jgi:hypothetical protein
MQHSRPTKGSILITTLVFASIAVIMISGLVTWFGGLLKGSQYVVLREQAFQVAEAGIEYYRWHLAHAQSDYYDGQGASSTGPYVHDFFDKDGVKLGTFSLTITPPPIGSTIVRITSIGKVVANPSIERQITVRLAIPSFAKYAIVANDEMRFGEGTEAFGPIHSNGGIRFDGLAHNLVTSALSTYDDPDHSGGVEFGVHTHVLANGSISNNFVSAEAPPNTPAARTDVFMAGRQFPVAAVDFTGITTDLAQMKSSAQTSGRYYAFSNDDGYLVVLKTNDTFDLYKVNSLVNPSNSCKNNSTQDTGWGSWSINTKTLLGNYTFPANGLIYFDDNVWVEGQINTARISIIAANFPDNGSNRRNITVNNDLLYTNYDGTDVVALIAQNNFNVGMVSDTNLRIDAALMAQNGRTGRYYYASQCSPYHARSSLTLYGMIGSNTRYGFGYTDGTGYDTRTIIYDANLLYAPPPSFPLTSDQYQIISWEEDE